MGDGDGAQEFYSARGRRVRVIGCLLLALVMVLLLVQMANTKATTTGPHHTASGFDPSVIRVYMAIGAAFTVFLLVCAVRAARCGMTLDDDGVTVRGVLRTRRWRWDEIRAATTRDRTSHRSALVGVASPRPPEPRTQVLPMLELTSGKTVQLQSMKIGLQSAGAPNWVDDAIFELNHRLEARRGDGGARPR